MILKKIEINISRFTIPADRRQTNWLFKRDRGVDLGITENKFS